MSALNSYDYTLLVKETVKNYCYNVGLLLPINFKKMEQLFFEDILVKHILWESTNVYDDTNGRHDLIININTIALRMSEFSNGNNLKFNEREVYLFKWLPIANLLRLYKKLTDIYNFGGLSGIHNLVDIYDQTYIVGDTDAEYSSFTRTLFIYDPKGDFSKYSYSPDFPLVLFDQRLGDFLGIPGQYWNKMRPFTLDCRSDMFLEIMKRWRTVLVAIRPCVDDYFKQCSRIYSRTGDKIPVWGNCPGFMEKIETLKPSTIIFKKEPRWQKEYESFIVGVDNPEIE